MSSRLPTNTPPALPTLPDYEVLDIIGKGGFGRVYRLRDLRMKRVVAAKSLLHSEDTLGSIFAEVKARFEREVEITANLNHPNTVTAYTTLTDSGDNFYLVLEYVSGGTLLQLLHERGSLPLDLALRITIDLCDALEIVWKQATVHRDIKPNNIFLVKGQTDEVERAKLGDFGAAMTRRETTAATSPTQMGRHPGTPLYMSPEQEFGKPFLDVRSDLYSLGLVLYEMLYGHPYKTSTMPWANASSPADPVLKRLLKENPFERYASPGELKRDLLLVRVGQPVPLPTTERETVHGATPSTPSQTPIPTATPLPTSTSTPSDTPIPSVTATPPQTPNAASTATQVFLPSGFLPPGDWSVRAFNTDNASVVIINDQLVLASVGPGEQADTGWTDINHLLVPGADNLVTVANWNAWGPGTWGFLIRQDDTVVWGAEDSTGGEYSLNYAATVAIKPDGTVEPVAPDTGVLPTLSGTWSVRIRETADVGMIVVNGVVVAGAGNWGLGDTDWIDITGLLYADIDNTIHMYVWNFDSDYSWRLSIRRDEATIWEREQSGSGLTGVVLSDSVRITAAGELIR